MAFLRMDNLRAAQMGSALAAASTAFSPNPASASGRLSATLQDSAQGSVTAIAAEKAAKRAKRGKKSGIGSLVGTVGGIVAAPFTAGLSVPAGMAIGGAAGGAVDSIISGDYGAAAGQVANAAGAYGGYKSAQGGSMADSVADAGATTPTEPLQASSSIQAMAKSTSPPPLVPSGGLDTAGYGNNTLSTTRKLASMIPLPSSPGRRDRLDNNPAAMLGPSVMDAPLAADTQGKFYRPGRGPGGGVQSPHGHRFAHSPRDIRRMSPDEQERFALQAKQAGVQLSPEQLAALKRPVRQQLKAAGTIPENAPSRWGLAMQGMFGAQEAMNQYGNNRYF